MRAFTFDNEATRYSCYTLKTALLHAVVEPRFRAANPSLARTARSLHSPGHAHTQRTAAAPQQSRRPEPHLCPRVCFDRPSFKL